MNFYDILAAEKWDGGISTMNFFDLLFAQSISGEQWQVYEGTLPATINANGSDMRQYQIWGNVGGVGDKTVNLFDKNDPDVLIGFEIKGYQISKNSNCFVTGYIPVNGLESYSISNLSSIMLCYDENKSYLYRKESFPINDSNAKFIRMNGLITNINTAMLTEGSTAPASFVPYGYKLDMSISSGNLCYKEITGANIDGTVTIIADSRYNTCIFECTQGETYTIKNEDTVIVYAFFDSEPRMGSSPYDNARVVVSGNTVSFTAPITGWCATRYITTNTPAMAVRGSAIPEKYQPYYNTVIPIYIGDEPLEKVGDYTDYADYEKQKVVRKIKKYVLDGTENWEQVLGADGDSTKNYFRFTLSSATYLNANFSRCSHFTWQWINASTTVVGFRTYIPTGSNAILFVVRPENVADMVLSDFKLWLAEQYAAGTPVTVWCALTTAEEIDPPVPLPALPTCEGTTVLDYVGQSVAPEKVLLEYAKGGN